MLPTAQTKEIILRLKKTNSPLFLSLSLYIYICIYTHFSAWINHETVAGAHNDGYQLMTHFNILKTSETAGARVTQKSCLSYHFEIPRETRQKSAPRALSRIFPPALKRERLFRAKELARVPRCRGGRGRAMIKLSHFNQRIGVKSLVESIRMRDGEEASR